MKTRTILLAAALLVFAAAFGQAEEQAADKVPLPERVMHDDTDHVYDLAMVPVEPEYPGGIEAMYEYLRENVHYPELAIQEKVEGRVYVGFVIDKEGAVTNVKVIRGVRPDLDQAAVEALRGMPPWTAGQLHGEAVRVRYVLPVSFKL